MLKETPLNAVHRAAGARMVDFGGWDMPVHYGSQIDEHHAVRSDAGMFDVSHMRVVDLEGAGARDFLRDALANNVDKLKDAGKALYSCLLTPQGTVIDDLIVYFLREDFFRLVVNAGTADKDIALVPQAHRGARAGPAAHAARGSRDGRRAGPERAREGLAGASRQRSGERGAQAFHARRRCTRAWGEVFIARTGYTGEDGFEIVLPATRVGELWHALAAAGVKPAGLGARDTLRLEAGMNLYGQDMDETVSPLESGLAWTVDLASPRDFVGKAALVANPPQRQMTGLLLTDKGGVLRAHQVVRTAARRRRDHERHLQPDARQVDRARAAAGGRCAGRHRQGRDPRPRARGESREAAVRAQRQGADRVTSPPPLVPRTLLLTNRSVNERTDQSPLHRRARVGARRSRRHRHVGITDHAQAALGDLVYLELPDVGRVVAAGEACAVVESVKAASDVYAPIAGEVLAVNSPLTDAPEQVNQDAYAAWFFKLKPADARRVRRAARRRRRTKR